MLSDAVDDAPDAPNHVPEGQEDQDAVEVADERITVIAQVVDRLDLRVERQQAGHAEHDQADDEHQPESRHSSAKQGAVRGLSVLGQRAPPDCYMPEKTCFVNML